MPAIPLAKPSNGPIPASLRVSQRRIPAAPGSSPQPTSPPAPNPVRPAAQNPLRSTGFWIPLVILLLANIFITNVLLAPPQLVTVTLPYGVFKQQLASGNVVSGTTTRDSIP